LIAEARFSYPGAEPSQPAKMQVEKRTGKFAAAPVGRNSDYREP
jgi:hypothetical protein